jgi:tetratricopeptide (TPR) repeat protein
MRKNESATFILAALCAVIVSAPCVYSQSEVAEEVRWKELDGTGGKALAEGRTADAEKAWKDAVQIAQRFGPGDGRFIISLNNLGELYQSQGKYADAEPYRQRALELMEQQLGPEHPLVVEGLDNLAKLYWLQGKHSAAEPLAKKLLTIVEKLAGPEHPNTAQVLNNLAEVYKAQGRYAEADNAHKHALAIRENALGESPEVAQSLTNLAELYRAQGKYSEAEPLYKRALAIGERIFGSEHADVVRIQEKLAQALRSMNRRAEADKLEAQVKTIRAKQGKPSP